MPTYLTQIPYWAGNITVTSTAATIISLIQAQSPDVNGACSQLNLQTDSLQSSAINIGQDNVSGTVYGYSMATPFTARNYNAGSLNMTIPLERMFVWAASSQILHVELYI